MSNGQPQDHLNPDANFEWNLPANGIHTQGHLGPYANFGWNLPNLPGNGVHTQSHLGSYANFGWNLPNLPGNSVHTQYSLPHLVSGPLHPQLLPANASVISLSQPFNPNPWFSQILPSPNVNQTLDIQLSGGFLDININQNSMSRPVTSPFLPGHLPNPVQTTYYANSPQPLTSPVPQNHILNLVHTPDYVNTSVPSQNSHPSNSMSQTSYQDREATQISNVPSAGSTLITDTSPRRDTISVDAPSSGESVTTSMRREGRFKGIRETSQKGKHTVLVYEIPNSPLAYIFMLHKRAASENTWRYQCVECARIHKYTSVLVVGDDFLSDPCGLSHTCIPKERTKDKAARMAYESLHQLRQDSRAALLPTITYWLNVIDRIETMPWGDVDKRLKVLYHYVRSGYNSRRSSYSRAIRSTIQTVTMDNVPDELQRLPDGTTFLQLKRNDMHVYVSRNLVRMAVQNGLFALVSDGIHQLNPRERRAGGRVDEGQIYTIHGICSGGFEVPLMFAVMKKKREEDYLIVFEKMKENITAASSESQGDPQLRIVVDFELAAINAYQRIFPQCSVEGCSWHLSQAWVRKRNTLGILQFLKGRNRSRRVVRWWRTLKGLPFLPRECFHLVHALERPPVPLTHPAYRPCRQFLEYLQSTWLEGPFAEMWCKYMKNVQRTTNTAENYHGRLRKIIGKRNPPLAKLILVFRSLTALAKATFMRMERFQRAQRPLRRRDRLRREKVDAAMAAFEELRRGPYLTTVMVSRYCRKMSRYTSEICLRKI